MVARRVMVAGGVLLALGMLLALGVIVACWVIVVCRVLLARRVVVAGGVVLARRMVVTGAAGVAVRSSHCAIPAVADVVPAAGMSEMHARQEIDGLRVSRGRGRITAAEGTGDAENADDQCGRNGRNDPLAALQNPTIFGQDALLLSPMLNPARWQCYLEIYLRRKTWTFVVLT
jgi:hypothetical protein